MSSCFDGAPTFGWRGNGLYISNSKFTTSYYASGKLTRLSGNGQNLILTQYLAT